MVLELLTFCTNGNREEEREVHIEMDSIKSKMGVFPIVKKEPFKLHLSNVENKRLLIQGETDVTVSIPCDRCLKEVAVGLRLKVEKELALDADDPMENGDDALDALSQAGYMDGYQLDVDKLMYAEILTGWPAKILCKEDCKGICSMCGADLNEGSCGCVAAPDPRMAAFQDVFSKFKEV